MTMNAVPLSIQLWSLRDAVKLDFAATMREVAAMGFAGVETAGFGNLDAAAAAAAVKAAGLRCSGMHVGIQALRHDFNEVLEHARLFGTTDVICPYFPRELMTSAAAYVALGEELDGLGAKLRAFGCRMHYHNHDFEVMRHDGRLGFDWLLDTARPANLGCEADVYWLQHAGKDPAAFVREQGRRIELLHLRDGTEIGSGPVDFPSVFAAVDAIGALRWQVVEIGRCTYDPLESARRSFAQLRAWGRV